MSPIGMTVLLVVSFAAFGYTVLQRWRLMTLGAPAQRFDRIGERLTRTLRFALGQWRLPRHRLAGYAHILIFFGAVITPIRALILFARGYTSDPHFGFGVFDNGTPLGDAYMLLKDIFVILVLLGIAVFLYYRVIRQLPRMTLNFEGLLILAILTGLMVADAIYDGATMARFGFAANAWEPVGSLVAIPLRDAAGGTQVFWQHLGFWGHVGLILGFMNILPYTKQFHEITGIPNVFFQKLDSPGRLEPLDDLEGKAERGETLGIARIEQFSWKSILDFYSCTECGRCSDSCPATSTGKQLSPKFLTVDLREHLYSRQGELIRGARAGGNGAAKIELVTNVVKPEVLWACTTCGACEQECPVFISYIDKIVDMRRYLAMEQGEFPEQLQNMFKGLETVGNPYSFANEDRAKWAEGLDIPLRTDKPDAEWLMWVGCAASFDDRARKIARTTAELMLEAGVNFSILGPEEQCNGDPARRAGNEYLFQFLAQANVETMNNYNVKKIVTMCPHCYNTLKNEYPNFGGNYEVVHHSELLTQLVHQGKLKPTHPVQAQVAYHDSCYLGRHNDIYDPPRDVLRSIPGLQLSEAGKCRDRAMCCGAGGAQMWKEEEEGDTRINHTRTNQLLEALPAGTDNRTFATSCPFCMTMLTDGLADQGHEGIETLDIAEILHRAVKGPKEKQTAKDID